MKTSVDLYRPVEQTALIYAGYQNLAVVPLHMYRRRRGWFETEWAAIVTQTHDHQGTSVVNAAESIATAIIDRYRIKPDRLQTIEFFPTKPGGFLNTERFSVVSFANADADADATWGEAADFRSASTPVRFHSDGQLRVAKPDWQHATRDDLAEIIGFDPDELPADLGERHTFAHAMAGDPEWIQVRDELRAPRPIQDCV